MKYLACLAAVCLSAALVGCQGNQTATTMSSSVSPAAMSDECTCDTGACAACDKDGAVCPVTGATGDVSFGSVSDEAPCEGATCPVTDDVSFGAVGEGDCTGCPATK